MSGKAPRLCPSCGSFYKDPPAVSRKHPGVNICPECGIKEALAAASMESLFGDVIAAYRAAKAAVGGKT